MKILIVMINILMLILFVACGGNKSVTKKSTSSGATPSGSTPSGSTPSGSTPSGSTPSGSTSSEKTPPEQQHMSPEEMEKSLTSAIDRNDVGAIRKLTTQDKNIVNKKLTQPSDYNDFTFLRGYEFPLFLAINVATVDTVRVLFEVGADIHASRNSYGDTPLIFAAKMNKKEVVKLLIDKGADVNAVNSDGDTALHVVSRMEGLKDVLKLLLETKGQTRLEINKLNLKNETALFYASESAVTMLLNEGCNQEIKNKDGNTALYVAWVNVNVGLAGALRSFYHWVDPTNKDTGLLRQMKSHYSNSNNSSVTYMNILYKMYPGLFPINIKNIDNGMTPLLLATAYKDKDFVRFLLENEAKKDVHNKKYGLAPIHMASLNNDKDSVGALCTSSEDAELRTQGGSDSTYASGKTALELLEGKPDAYNDVRLILSKCQLTKKQ